MRRRTGSNLLGKRHFGSIRQSLSLTLAVLMALGIAGTARAADDETGRTYAKIMTESDVTLNGYNGQDVYFWKHDAANPSQLLGGAVTVVNAELQKSGDNALITLVTDHSGLDLKNETAVRAVLKSLADKLTYNAYTGGERNLDGRVSIYEGLTFASASMKTSTLGFNESTGKAVITEVKTPFTAVLGEDDKEYKERNVLQEDGAYKFTEDTIIHPDFNITKEDNYLRDFASIYATKDTVIDMTGHGLTINMHGNIYNGGGYTSRACGIYVPGKGTLKVNHPGAIDIDLDATYYYYGGIGVMTKDSHVLINNDTDPAHRVKIRVSTPNYAVNVTGLKTFGGTIDITGLVDIYTNGAWGTNAAGGRISVGGGTIHTDNYDAVTARSGGIMNVNVKGTVKTGLAPGENNVTIVGNLGSMGAWVGGDENAEVNVALMNERSSLTGRAHELKDTPDEDEVGIRLFLQNKAQWRNTGDSSLRQLYGNRDAAHVGFIDMSQNGENDLNLARFSGHTVVYYPHNETDPTVLGNGNIRIGRAYLTDGEKATLYVRTDRTGIDETHLEDENYVNQILYELAQKLNYVAYNNGERNLQGWAQLAEGMTAPEAVKKAEILFKKDGVGYIADYMQGKTDFTTTLTGNKATDEEYVAAKVLKEENKPSFMFDSTIRLQDANGIEAKNGAELQVDLKNTLLHIDVNGVGTPSAGIYVEGSSAQIKSSSKGKLNLTGEGDSVGISVKSDASSVGRLSVLGDTGLSISGFKTSIELLGADQKNAVMSVDNYSIPLTITNSDPNDTAFVGIKTDKGTLNIDGSLAIHAGKGLAIEGEVKAYGVNIKSEGDVALKTKGEGWGTQLYAGSPKTSDSIGRDVLINAGEGNIAVDGSDGNFTIGGNGWGEWIRQKPGKVYITGDIITGKAGEISLQGRESYWKGGLGEGDNARLRLALLDGAHWYNMPSGNAGQAAVLSALLVNNNNLQNVNAPYIHQDSDRDIEIKSLTQGEARELKVLYKHDSAAPSSILGGKFIIHGAKVKFPLISLITDSDHIDMQNAGQVSQVLDALAHKLIYKKQGDNYGIIGKVRIAESLTNPEQSLKDGFISFRRMEAEGYLEGFYTAPVSGILTVPLTTEEEKDRLYTEKGIRISNKLYAFHEDTVIEADVPVDIMKQKRDSLILAGENRTLNLKGKGIGISIKGEGSYPSGFTLALKNLKAINISVDGTLPKSRGIYVKNAVLNLSQYLSAGGGGGKNTVISVTGNTRVANGKDFVGLEVDGENANCSSEFPLHIVAPGGTTILAKQGRVRLNNKDNSMLAPGGNLLKLQDMGKYGSVLLVGKELIGDVDLREAGNAEERNVAIQVNSDGGTWTGGFLFENQDNLKTTVELWDGPGNGNGPTWINQVQHPQLEMEERINQLEGSAESPYVGTVVQKSNHDLLIDRMIGNVRFCFDHDKEASDQILGGDIKITAAPFDARAYLRTDNAGIDIDDTPQVTKVLKALAHKLYYLNYTTGERKLTGVAEIAEALTSTSVLKQGEIAFDETTGQGYFDDTPQVPSQAYTKFTTPITGVAGDDIEYANNGIRLNAYQGYYMFHADSSVTPQKNPEAPYRAAIDAKQSVYVGLNSHSLNLNMENDSLDSWDVAGVWAERQPIAVYKGKEVNISVTNNNGKAAGIVARDGGEVTIEGITNIHAPVAIEARGGAVSLTAGTIQSETLADVEENGLLTIDTADTAPAVLSGQWKQDEGKGRLSLGKGSAWTGDSWLGGGQLEVSLQDGGRWNLTEESNVSLLRGGVADARGGIVDQRQLGALMQEQGEDRYLDVERFSGSMTFLYGHDKTDLSKVIGGLIRVNKAEEDSRITLLTDREGLSEADLLEKEKVEPLLDALAQKLYYTSYKEEDNLQGIVKIAEGMTGQSVAKVTGAIYYTGEDGQGRYKLDSAEPKLYPGSQQVTEFHTPITGSVERDRGYLEAGVMKIADEAKPHYDFTKEKTSVIVEIDAEGAVIAGENDFDINMNGHLLSLKNKGDNGILVTHGKQALLRKGSHVTVEAQKTGIKAEGEGSKFRTVSGGVFNIYAPIAFEAQKGGDISVGTGTIAADMLGRAEDGGTINLFTPDDKVKTELSGDILVCGKKSRMRLGVASKGSTWTGGMQNEDGTVELGLLNGGVWNNTGKTDARLTTLDARSDSPILGNGTIHQLKDSGRISTDSFKGKLTLLYTHEAAAPSHILGGTFAVEKAAPGSEIVLRTDRSGLDLASKKAADKNLVSETLNNLANKLYYTGFAATGEAHEENLTGIVEIAEGLTAQSAAMKTGSITYKTADGQGQYLYTPAVDPEDPPTPPEPPTPPDPPTPPTPPEPPIIYGDKETVMMRGSKSAMTAATLLWRGNNNDLQRRMGDVRLGKEDSGIWARYLGGKNELDQPKTTFKQTYNLAQVGYDKKAGDWMLGMALDYGTANDTYASGTGKEKLGSLALYGTRQSKDGQYLDLIVRGSQLKNDYTVYNEMGHKLDGNYKTWGMSFSAEYGKRFVKGNGFYIDPSIELTAGHLNGKDYDAVSDYAGGKKMHVQQDGVNSVIGRLGIGMGYETATSNLFAKVALAHEFGGKLRSTFSAAGEPTSSTEVDLKDTWIDLEVGGSWQVNKDTYLYGTYTRNFGADLSNKWRVDAGVRFSF